MSIGTNSELGYRSIIATEPEIVYGVAQTTTSATNYTEVTSFSTFNENRRVKIS